MRRSLVPILALAFVILSPRTAIPWGIGPGHFSNGYDLAYHHKYSILPETDNPELFIRANACPDLAWTQTFKNAGLSYVHTPEFAEVLYLVAVQYEAQYGNPDWITISHGHGGHIASDFKIHSTLENVSDHIHLLVELSIDTIIFYKGTPIDHSRRHPDWKKINVGHDACNPDLFRDASIKFQEGKGGPTIQWWHMYWGVLELASTIAAEYTYHELSGNTNQSEAFLQSLVDAGVLQQSWEWESVYRDSLEAAKTWIIDHY